MPNAPVSGDMRVSSVPRRYPCTYEVFRGHGCPDMRSGLFAVSAKLMKVRWAARVHRIAPDVLLADLNAAVLAHVGEDGGGTR